MNGNQKQRAEFAGLTTDKKRATVIGTGQKLTCACNGTVGPSAAHWLGRNGKVLPKLKKTASVDYKPALRRKKPGTAVHLRIKKGFSCAEAGEYTCVIGESRRSVLVTPVGG